MDVRLDPTLALLSYSSLQFHYNVWSHTYWRSLVSVLPTEAQNNPLLHVTYRLEISEDWNHVWTIIASISGLRKLQVELMAASEWKAMWPAQEAVMLEAVKAVTAPFNFKLILPFVRSPHLHEMYSSLCQVVVPEEDGCVTLARIASPVATCRAGELDDEIISVACQNLQVIFGHRALRSKTYRRMRLISMSNRHAPLSN
ncbi:uncharacterized protein BDZ99DRAFT_289775 [Mytilinidion resinicola]|uniref:DUF7730 domain-containing protein n=1 Tax=Mytilinidion resinicola TaxID=574789 RepID=A0A6A6YPL5_9PEZI|nr:uncharacterized protein BDZ99DRAFT_289775 [Mytilinidion resinicola]KAF2810822.1 hypothetical protein BDZ99DRAFT_289775 [Mytilinidion resinicola]